MSWMLYTLREGMIIILQVGGPIIFLVAAIGLSIGLIQTVTNVQDQTTPSAIKITSVLFLFLIAGVWMFNHLTEFTKRSIDKSFSMVKENTQNLEINDEDFKTTADFTETFSGALLTRGSGISSANATNPTNLINNQAINMINTFSKGLKINNFMRNSSLSPMSYSMPPYLQQPQYNYIPSSIPPIQETPKITEKPPLIKVSPVLPNTNTEIRETGDSLPNPKNSDWF